MRAHFNWVRFKEQAQSEDIKKYFYEYDQLPGSIGEKCSDLIKSIHYMRNLVNLLNDASFMLVWLRFYGHPIKRIYSARQNLY